MRDAASLIMRHEHFLPFSKTGSDNKNYQCIIKKSEWNFEEKSCSYTIAANRFLRGMVRLIVGACLNAGYEKLSIDTIEECLSNQKPLPLQWSVPPEGLCFQNVAYPTIDES